MSMEAEETFSSDWTTAPPETLDLAATDLAVEDCVDELLTVAVAIKVTVPSPTAVMTPDEFTVATAVSCWTTTSRSPR